MQQASTRRQTARLLRVLFAALLLLVLLCLRAALVVQAAPSPPVQAVLGQLSTLQNAHIDPAWPPDIEANKALVQALLDDYKALTASQRAELTSAQNSDLRAYFEALYKLEGKGTAALDSLFAGGAAAGSSSSSRSQSSSSSSSHSQSSSSSSSRSQNATSSSSSSSSSSSKAASAPPASSASASSAPASSTVSANSGAGAPVSSLPAQTGPSSSPPPSSAHSAAAAGSSRALPSPVAAAFPPQLPGSGGSLSLLGSAAFGQFLLVLITGLLAFLVLRFLFAMRAAGPAPDTKAYQRAQRKLQARQAAGVDAALPHAATLNPDFEMAEELTPAERRAQKRALRAQRRASHTPPPVAEPLPPTNAESWASQKPINPAEMDAIARMFSAPSKAGPQDAANPLGIVSAPEAESTPAAPKPKKTTRTGRPRRMRFSQGDAHDIDAIDD